MSPTEFSKSLLKSASIDTPRAGAKAKAVEKVMRTLGTISAGGGGAVGGAAAASKLGFAAAAAALVGVAGLGGGYVLGRATTRMADVHSEAPIRSERTPTPSQSNAGGPNSATPSPSSSDEPEAVEAAAGDVCSGVSALPSKACTKRGGRGLTFSLKNACSETPVDVFWVNDACDEIYKGMISPAAVFYQESWEGHVFRVRDHATHRLIKEFTPTLVDGAPDREKYWSGPPTELPVVTVDAEDEPLPEAAPAECAHGGGRAARLRVRNERSLPIAISFVNPECKEVDTFTIQPGKTFDRPTSEGHAFRIRDVSGQTLIDIPPASPDMMTYLSVP
jgi:hypothetical protein